MKKANRQVWTRLENQQNNFVIQQPHIIGHSQKITGWDDQKPLIEHNLNTFGHKLNQLRQKSQTRKSNFLHYLREPKTTQRKRRSAKRQSSKINPSWETQQPQNPQFMQETIKYQISHIQLLKVQVKHLQNDQISQNKFPNFNGLNQSQMIEKQFQQNINQLELKQIEQVRRKIRTQSTKRNKKQNNAQIRKGNSVTPTTASSKFYRTLTNQWMRSDNQHIKNSSHLITQVPSKILNKYNQQESSLKLDASTILGQQKPQQWKTIHWKKSKPFTKFFQSKRSKSKKSEINPQAKSQASKNLNLIQGRKLYQLLTLNRQMIQMQGIYL